MIRQGKNKKILRLFCVLFSVSFAIVPLSTWAAVLYLEPSQSQYQPGDTFIVEARIDTEDECINAVEANLSFSKDILEAVDFSQGNSILTLWVKKPEINQEAGLISFSGGIPGGYCGILPGDPGKSNLLGKIVFRAVPREVPRSSAQVIFRDDSQVLLNDGLGTSAKLSLKGAIFTILPEKLEVPKKEWQEEIKKDNIPPEPFELKIHQDHLIFEGKYFIVFSTTDKQTGLDHFEVKEGKKGWKKAESPYLLEDQGLKSIIRTRAVDKAGNERVAEILPPKKLIPYWIIVPILIGAGVGYWIIKSVKRKAKNAK